MSDREAIRRLVQIATDTIRAAYDAEPGEADRMRRDMLEKLAKLRADYNGKQ